MTQTFGAGQFDRTDPQNAGKGSTPDTGRHQTTQEKAQKPENSGKTGSKNRTPEEPGKTPEKRKPAENRGQQGSTRGNQGKIGRVVERTRAVSLLPDNPDNLQTNSATRPARRETPRKQATRGARWRHGSSACESCRTTPRPRRSCFAVGRSCV